MFQKVGSPWFANDCERTGFSPYRNSPIETQKRAEKPWHTLCFLACLGEFQYGPKPVRSQSFAVVRKSHDPGRFCLLRTCYRQCAQNKCFGYQENDLQSWQTKLADPKDPRTNADPFQKTNKTKGLQFCHLGSCLQSFLFGSVFV